ncbi:glycine--tRNA ligase [Candidatus Woesebacteria bacterium]|nr:MAG: glycine--tRNA ligase [Candidatus Woesebacteria bacterium]
MQEIASLCKRRGFVFQSSEIYGGWEASYDFGPLGAEMLRNLRNLWWEEFVQRKDNVVGLDGAIISHPRVWEASGHVESFSDVMVEDIKTHKRYRADHLSDKVEDGMKPEEVAEIIKKYDIKSPDGNPLSEPKYFNQLVEVEIGTTQNTKTKAYLRGETCQPIFYNYALVKDAMRLKLPFAIAQIGKAFRNEIKVGPYFFRTREFEQMELEMYVNPKDATAVFEDFKKWSLDFLTSIGLKKDDLRLRDQEFKERAHYNKVATDVEYRFKLSNEDKSATGGEWKEFQGIHYRSDWDLMRHGKYSGSDFTYYDEETKEKFIPHVVEYSIGLNRLMLVLLNDAYTKEEKRVVLKLHPKVAPYKASIFPLLANKPELVKKAREIYDTLRKSFNVSWDDRGNIGKRYLSQDEIGTPWCITVDFDTLKDASVTIRDRDTTKQERISIEKLTDWLHDKLAS